MARALRLLPLLPCVTAYTTAPAGRPGASKHSYSLVSDIYVPPEPREDCKALSPATSDEWCATSCVMDPPNCPAAICECEGGNPGAAPTTESENQERKRMAEIYENERKNEEARAKAEKEREEADKKRAEEDAKRIADTEAAAASSVAAVPAGMSLQDAEVVDDNGSGAPVAFLSTKDAKSCKAVKDATVDDTWCETNCGNSPPNCPADMCACSKEVAEVMASPSPEPVLAIARDPSSTQQEAAKILADKEKSRQQAEAARVAQQEARLEGDKDRVKQSDTSVKNAWDKKAKEAAPLPAVPAPVAPVTPDAPEAPVTPAAPVAPVVPDVSTEVPAVPLVPVVPAVSPAPLTPGLTPVVPADPRDSSPEEMAAAKIAEEAEEARLAREADRVAAQEARASSDESRVEQFNDGVSTQWEKTAKEVEEIRKAKAEASPAPTA